VEKRGKKACAASFVLTIAAASMHVECKKSTGGINPPEPEPLPSSSASPTPSSSSTVTVTVRSRPDGRCYMQVPMDCPPGVMCNPPPPEEVDCPSNMRDANAPKASTHRPPGKEDWLRIASHVYASDAACAFYDERFCAPPGKKYECTPYPTEQKLKCTKLTGDAATRFRVDAFVYKDFARTCHRVPAMECAGNCDVPEGEIVPCS
jgi:hypothetical protein